MILYIAGPMTGLPDLNFPAFDLAESALQTAGYSTLNPARHGGEEPGKQWIGYLARGLYDVMNADGIALLPDWETSKGARVEVTLAEVHDKPVRALDLWLNHAHIHARR